MINKKHDLINRFKNWMYQWLYWFLYSTAPIQYEDDADLCETVDFPEFDDENDIGIVATPFIKSSNLQK